MTKPTQQEKEVELRNILNNFLQDVDTTAQVPVQTANAIVDVYLRKFQEAIASARKETIERVRKVFKKSFVTTDVYLVERFLKKLESLEAQEEG